MKMGRGRCERAGGKLSHPERAAILSMVPHGDSEPRADAARASHRQPRPTLLIHASTSHVPPHVPIREEGHPEAETATIALVRVGPTGQISTETRDGHVHLDSAPVGRMHAHSREKALNNIHANEG